MPTGSSVPGTPDRRLVAALRSSGGFVAGAGRALGAHWPQIIALFLAGWAGRMGFLWLATMISNVSPTVAVLIIPLAPMSTLLSFVLMLRAMAPSLPALAGTVESHDLRIRLAEDLAVAGQVLIPFLAVYASAGLLRQDTQVFLLDSATDEGLNTLIQDIDWGRADYAPGWTILVFIVVALAARKLIALRGLADRHLAWAGLAAYLEALWIMTLATALTSQLEELAAWVMSRRLVVGVISWGGEATEVIRGWGSWAGAAVDAVVTLLGNLGAVVIIPVAWLAIGATVYGHALRSKEHSVAGHEATSRRIEKIPHPVRRVVGQIVEPVVTPVTDAVEAIRRVAVAGAVPMAVFCLVFLLVGGVQALVALALRAMLGPGAERRQFALEPYLTMIERGVYFVLVLALLAAAVNVVIQAQRDASATDAAALR